MNGNKHFAISIESYFRVVCEVISFCLCQLRHFQSEFDKRSPYTLHSFVLCFKHAYCSYGLNIMGLSISKNSADNIQILLMKIVLQPFVKIFVIVCMNVWSIVVNAFLCEMFVFIEEICAFLVLPVSSF